MSSLKQDTVLGTNSYVDRRKRIRRLVILVLLVSVGVHIVAGIGAGIWVVARYFAKPEAKFVAQNRVEMKPEERQHRESIDQLDSMRARPVLNNRIQSLKPSALVLPDLPKVPMDVPVPIATVPDATAQLGTGTGQFGTGTGNGGGFFGATGNPNGSLLEGTFYDLKQTDRGRPTDMGGPPSGKGNKAYLQTVSAFIKHGMPPSGLRQYFQAPNKLYLSQLAIPVMHADKAPEAFKVKVEPRNWVVVYRGTVMPPEDGTYRFAGEGDDVLVVRFDKKIVLDGSLARKFTNGGYPYTNWHPKDPLSDATGASIVLGDWIKMEKDTPYPIEILIGEQPGNGFSQALYIQKEGAIYETHKDGLPILPFFRIANVSPPAKGARRPYASNGPVFRAFAPSATPKLFP